MVLTTQFPLLLLRYNNNNSSNNNSNNSSNSNNNNSITSMVSRIPPSLLLSNSPSVCSITCSLDSNTLTLILTLTNLLLAQQQQHQDNLSSGSSTNGLTRSLVSSLFSRNRKAISVDRRRHIAIWAQSLKDKDWFPLRCPLSSSSSSSSSNSISYNISNSNSRNS